MSLLEFYTEEVAQSEGVQPVETSAICKGYNSEASYIL